MRKIDYGGFCCQMSDTFFENIPNTTMQTVNEQGVYRRWGKRFLDIVAVILILPIALPVVLCVWALTKADGGEGLFAQTRVGRDGRLFRCWKIRTMVPDADRVLARLLKRDPAIAAEWHTRQKLDDDPRITAFGRVLRRTSIDELPQLWNVLIGEMSLIGPRPFTPNQKNLYDEASNDPSYYSVRPGISGIWQVECRSEGSFKDRFEFDERYLRTLNFSTDINIAWKTVKVILKATGT